MELIDKGNKTISVLIVIVNESDNYQSEYGYSDELKNECLTMYVNGMGIRAIARVKKIHHTTIINQQPVFL